MKEWVSLCQFIHMTLYLHMMYICSYSPLSFHFRTVYCTKYKEEKYIQVGPTSCRQSLPEDARKYFDPASRVLEAPMTIRVADQVCTGRFLGLSPGARWLLWEAKPCTPSDNTYTHRTLISEPILISQLMMPSGLASLPSSHTTLTKV